MSSRKSAVIFFLDNLEASECSFWLFHPWRDSLCGLPPEHLWPVMGKIIKKYNQSINKMARLLNWLTNRGEVCHNLSGPWVGFFSILRNMENKVFSFMTKTVKYIRSGEKTINKKQQHQQQNKKMQHKTWKGKNKTKQTWLKTILICFQFSFSKSNLDGLL